MPNYTEGWGQKRLRYGVVACANSRIDICLGVMKHPSHLRPIGQSPISIEEEHRKLPKPAQLADCAETMDCSWRIIEATPVIEHPLFPDDTEDTRMRATNR